MIPLVEGPANTKCVYVQIIFSYNYKVFCIVIRIKVCHTVNFFKDLCFCLLIKAQIIHELRDLSYEYMP